MKTILLIAHLMAIATGTGMSIANYVNIRIAAGETGERRAALAQLPPGWELLYLGYEHGERASAWDRVKQAAYLPLAALRLIHFTPREVLGLHAAPYSKNLRRAGKHHCTHAYAVSPAGARKLLAAQTPVAFSSDQLLVKLCIAGQLEAYVAEPKFFGQDSWHGRTAAYTSS